MRRVVPAIQAAFPVLKRSFFPTWAALQAASLPFWTTADSETVDVTLLRIPPPLSLLDPILLLPLLPEHQFSGEREREHGG